MFKTERHSAKYTGLLLYCTVFSLALFVHLTDANGSPRQDSVDRRHNTTQTINIFSNGFSPATLAAIPGDTIVWANVTTDTIVLKEGWPPKLYLPINSTLPAVSRTLNTEDRFVSPIQNKEIMLPPGGTYTQTLSSEGLYLYHLPFEPISYNRIDVIDSDGDRLPDPYETNDGIYRDPNHTGTDPFDPDTDGDGLLDGDELLGTQDGLDLPALGAHPLQMDILIEYDWLEDDIDSDFIHSHRPPTESLALLSRIFAGSDLENPDGSTGIRLIHDYGQGGAFTGGNLIADDDGLLSGEIKEGEFASYKLENFAPNRHGYFHYVILAHRYGELTNSSSGIAELNGDDIIVTLGGSYGRIDFVAAAIMHELGHNLGLNHGGDSACNFKPNYNSIMNYRFEFLGVDDASCDTEPDGLPANLDYSRGGRLPLDENDLNEPAGVCGSRPIDFNRNGIINSPVIPVAANLNAYNNEVEDCGGFLTTLTDYNDWHNLNLSAFQQDRLNRNQSQLIYEAPLFELTSSSAPLLFRQ